MTSLYYLANALLAALLLVTPAAEAPRTAVFSFELDDTSLQGAMQGLAPDDRARLLRLDAQLLESLARSGQYRPFAAADPDGPILRSCNGCETDAAHRLGAQVAVTGWVQKVSNLILNINVVVRDVTSGRLLAAGSVDIRGDTDESWTRGLAYLLRNRILAGSGGTP